MIGYFLRSLGRSALQKTLSGHFEGGPLAAIVTAARDFPITSRVDVQTGLERVLGERSEATLLGIHSQMNHETRPLRTCSLRDRFQVELGPLQHDELDIGDPVPVRCLKNGLWLARSGDVPFAILLAPSMQFGHVGGVPVEIAVPTGEAGAEFSRELFRDLEVRREGPPTSQGETRRGHPAPADADTAGPQRGRVRRGPRRD